MAQGLLPVASLFLTRQVVDAVGAYLVQTPGAKTPGALLALLPWVAAVVVAGWVLRAGSGIVAEAQAEAVSDHVQGALQEKTAEIDLAYHETAVWHDQMRLAQSEAMTRPVGIVRNLTQLGSGTLVLASVVGVLGASQGVLLPVLLAAAVPGALARVWNSRRWHAWRVAQSPAERQAGYLHLVLTAFPFAKEIRLLGLAGELRRRFAAVRAGLRRSRLALGRRRAGVEIAADAVSALALLGGLGVIYLRLVGNAMTLGDLALLYGGFSMFIFVTSLVAFFLAEIGDKTQLATGLLAARYSPLWQVIAGTTLGMLLVNVPTVLLGERFARHLPFAWIRRAAALLFAVLGSWVLARGTL